jgi:pimeloyl-ACP methyl ester carboxylesterase
LGYEQVKLYGYSYGSLLAMAVMRDYPTAVHSVILDSLLPLGADLSYERAGCLQSGLDALFAACAGDPTCAAAYPDLAPHFWSVVKRLRTTPLDIQLPVGEQTYVVRLDDQIFIRYVFLLLQQNAIGRLPAAIEAVYLGDYHEPAWAWLGYARSQGNVSRRGNTSAAGLYYSTLCSYLGAFPAEAREDATAADGSALHPALVEYAATAFAPCSFWAVPPLEAEAVSLLSESEIPTLILVGAFDAGLAPYLSQSVLPQLTHGYYYELHLSHGAIFSPCGLSLTYDFLADPTRAPDASCVEEMGHDWVLPE